MDITEQIVAPAFTLAGAIVGAGITYFIEKQRQKHEKYVRQIEERKSNYRRIAIPLLKRFRDAESKDIDDEFLEGIVDILLSDDKGNSVSKGLILLKDETMWNDHQKYNHVMYNIIPEMRKRLKELSEEEAKAKSWWQFWRRDKS